MIKTEGEEAQTRKEVLAVIGREAFATTAPPRRHRWPLQNVDAVCRVSPLWEDEGDRGMLQRNVLCRILSQGYLVAGSRYHRRILWVVSQPHCGDEHSAELFANESLVFKLRDPDMPATPKIHLELALDCNVQRVHGRRG